MRKFLKEEVAHLLEAESLQGQFRRNQKDQQPKPEKGFSKHAQNSA
jgi:hypothetical protein